MGRVAIFGAGGMGTALAMLFANATDQVRLWSRDPAHAEAFARTRVNERHLPGIRVPDSIRITSSGAEAAEGADLIVAAIPTTFLRATLERLAADVPPSIPTLSVVKGIEYGTFARPSQIIRAALGPRPVAVLSGPSHAEELCAGCRLRSSSRGRLSR